MKTKKLILLALCASGTLFNACQKYLSVDQYFNDMLNSKEKIFASKEYTSNWLTSVYRHLKDTGAQIVNKGDGGNAFSFISDDMIFGDRQDRIRRYQNCEYSADDQIYETGRWAFLYEGIRKASVFLQYVDNCIEMNMNEIADAKAQARFLRAHFYWMLLRQFGPIPIVPDEGQDVSLPYEQLGLPRNSYDDCVDYITAELALAAGALPTVRSATEVARPTRGAALATRAKVFLFAASPLYNGNNELFDLVDNTGKQLINQTYSEFKWAKAAAAAKEVIDLGQYDLYIHPYQDRDIEPYKKTIDPPYHPVFSENVYPNGWKGADPMLSYSEIFNGGITISKNPEFIFTQVEWASGNTTDIAKHAAPTTLGGYNCNAMTLKQVKAYYMNDGKTIYESPEYQKNKDAFSSNSDAYRPLPANVSLQYANREPRFYASAAYNGSIWENNSTTNSALKNRQIFYYKGEPNGKILSSPDFYVRTGVGVKKYYHPDDSWSEGGQRTRKYEPSIRYADVLLWYAEALNELTGSHIVKGYNEVDIVVNRDVNQIQYAMKRIRMRAGLPDILDNTYQNQHEFRKILKLERQIEFFGENARYWDLRRWKDAAIEENMPIMGANLDMKGDNAQRPLFYAETVITSVPKIFIRKMYLWPIETGELRRNGKLTQNPGW
ncbi:RagB/SusD family nutrient uptake outer membrane protein [Sphingobacterium sp. Mn56C]|uniref:RagB/SusD family nutrient uptake outer membrane protein n=1 Tax=Sphingobacterium sp. Mn56C TaxID=3395261 RepID=UPI003BD4486A